MKVLFFNGEGAMQFVRRGYLNAMINVGMNCTVIGNRTTFDVFNEFCPDAVFCHSYEIAQNKALYKCLLHNPQIKVMLWGGNWGSFDKEMSDIDKKEHILMVSDEERKIITTLKENNNIKCVFAHYPQRWTNVTHNGWEELGLKPVGLALAADIVDHFPVEPNNALACDVSFIGGYWPYKGERIDKYLLPLCHPSENLSIKIFGWGNWPVAQHLGSIDQGLVNTLFASSTINANVFEPHASKYGFDLNERGFKCLAAKGFVVSEYTASMAEDLCNSNEMVFCKTPKEFKDNILYFLAHPKEREPYIERGFRSVRKNHNYFVRLKDMLQSMDLYDNIFKDRLENIIGAL